MIFPSIPCAQCFVSFLSLILDDLSIIGFSPDAFDQNRILGDIVDQLEQIFALVFENYKSLHESTPSGIMDVFRPATGVAAPVLKPAVQLYSLLHDILSPEAQNKLYSYFQAWKTHKLNMLLFYVVCFKLASHRFHRCFRLLLKRDQEDT